MITMLKKTGKIFSLQNSIQEITIGIAARDINIIDYTQDLKTVRNNEKNLLSEICSLEKQNILFLNQVHEDSILIIDTPPTEDFVFHGDADAMITDIPGICLVIRTADCVPIFAYDPVNKVLGAAHSGWRGTQLKIAGNMIKEMKDVYNCKATDIHAYIFPSIGPQSYEINEDVSKHFPHDHEFRNGKIYLNLWQNIIRILKDEGLDSNLIYNAGICSMIQSDNFFSHRKGDLGRNLNFAYIEK
jgi:YfiH family protein